ncbi:MAG: molybdenum cofactor guanylyltransferase [Oscillospiraceae bacterium]
MTLGGLILAGGKSSRMGGRNKALLKLDGLTYIERIAASMSGLDECLLSVAPGSSLHLEGFTNVEDVYPEMGPMGGLYSSLATAKSSALLVAPCDTPLFSKQLAQYIIGEVKQEDDILLVEDEGRVQPLIGIYSRRCIPVMERQILAGDLRMRSLAENLRLRTIPLPPYISSRTLLNINSENDVASINNCTPD